MWLNNTLCYTSKQQTQKQCIEKQVTRWLCLSNQNTVEINNKKDLKGAVQVFIRGHFIPYDLSLMKGAEMCDSNILKLREVSLSQ